MDIEEWKRKKKAEKEKMIKKVPALKLVCIVYFLTFGGGAFYLLNKILTNGMDMGYVFLIGLSVIAMVMSVIGYLFLHKHAKFIVVNNYKPSKRSWNWYKTLLVIKHESPAWQFIFTMLAVININYFYYQQDILSGLIGFGLLAYVSYSWADYVNDIRKNQNKIFFKAITKNKMRDISKIDEISEDWMFEDTDKSKGEMIKSLNIWYKKGCPNDIDYLDLMMSQILKTRMMVALDETDVRRYEIVDGDIDEEKN